MISRMSPGHAAHVGPGAAGVVERLGHHRQGWWEADRCPDSVLQVESSFTSCAGFKSQPFQCARDKVTEPVPIVPSVDVGMESPCEDTRNMGEP